MNDISPNNTMRASQLWNDPMLSAFLGLAPDQDLDVGPVQEQIAVFDPTTGEPYTPQGPTNALARFRHDFPYVPVIPFPNQVRTVALIQNLPKELNIPDRVVAILLRGSGNYYVSNNGNAEIPLASQDNDSGTNTSRSLYKPEQFMFYTGGIRTLSLITPDAAGCVVTMLGYAPTEVPRYA